MKTLEAETRQSGTQFGIIYIGDELDSSDAEWAGKVVERFKIYEQEHGGRQRQTGSQKFERHPKRRG